jgi:hypothetical protein
MEYTDYGGNQQGSHCTIETVVAHHDDRLRGMLLLRKSQRIGRHRDLIVAAF